MHLVAVGIAVVGDVLAFLEVGMVVGTAVVEDENWDTVDGVVVAVEQVASVVVAFAVAVAIVEKSDVVVKAVGDFVADFVGPDFENLVAFDVG